MCTRLADTAAQRLAAGHRIDPPRLFAYVTNLVEVYAQVLACFARTGHVAEELRLFSDACDGAFVPAPAAKQQQQSYTQSSGSSSGSSDGSGDGGECPSLGARARAPLSAAGRAIKDSLAAAQEAALCWLHGALTHATAPQFPAGFAAYQLRRLFFLDDPKTFLGKPLTACSSEDVVGYRTAARHIRITARSVTVMLALTQCRKGPVSRSGVATLYGVLGLASLVLACTRTHARACRGLTCSYSALMCVCICICICVCVCVCLSVCPFVFRFARHPVSRAGERHHFPRALRNTCPAP